MRDFFGKLWCSLTHFDAHEIEHKKLGWVKVCNVCKRLHL